MTRFATDLDQTLARASEGLALARDIRLSLAERFARPVAPSCLWQP